MSVAFPDVSAAILAGGRSTRMGRDKATLPLGDATAAKRLIELAAPLASETMLVEATPRDEEIEGARRIVDLVPESGPLGGTHAALAACRTDRLVVLSCDLLLLDAASLAAALSTSPASSALVPTIQGIRQPQLVVYRVADALPVASSLVRRRADLPKSALSIRRLAAELDADELPLERTPRFDPASLTNVNTPEEYERVSRLLGEK
ncbi:MAG: NTP transferase domain-containing protein [Ignavibacteriales bacterium]|nr:NTP transferase domain-containing protein [Ignavibacteriales bacterium]